jgi:hypothetical protein
MFVSSLCIVKFVLTVERAVLVRASDLARFFGLIKNGLGKKQRTLKIPSYRGLRLIASFLATKSNARRKRNGLAQPTLHYPLIV